jgi:hypothetical protein
MVWQGAFHVSMASHNRRLSQRTVPTVEPRPEFLLALLDALLHLATQAQRLAQRVHFAAAGNALPRSAFPTVLCYPFFVGFVGILELAINVPEEKGRVVWFVPGAGGRVGHDGVN